MITEYGEWQQTKPKFYGDSRVIGASVLRELESHELDLDANQLDQSPRGPFVVLEQALKLAVYKAFESTAVNAPACPYHEVLAMRLGKRALPSGLDITQDKLDLVEATLPGGSEAPVLITSLISRMDAIGKIFELDVPPEDLARLSVGLINAPLRHPQQWAKAFIFTLTEPTAVKQLGGSAFTFDRSGFLPETLVTKYLRARTVSAGTITEWSMPIADFTLSTPVRVHSRTHGSERVVDETTILYAEGTRLGDIAVDEPTLTCPGKPMAHYLWAEAVRLCAKHDLWARNQHYLSIKNTID